MSRESLTAKQHNSTKAWIPCHIRRKGRRTTYDPARMLAFQGLGRLPPTCHPTGRCPLWPGCPPSWFHPLPLWCPAASRASKSTPERPPSQGNITRPSGDIGSTIHRLKGAKIRNIYNPFLLILNVPLILKTGIHLQFPKISVWPIWLLIDPL